MITKYDTNEKVFVKGTVDSAISKDGKIYYKIRECTELIPEDICTQGSFDIDLNTNMAKIDEAKIKIEHIRCLLKEAMDIAESIASLRLDLRINAIVNDKSTEFARITTE